MAANPRQGLGPEAGRLELRERSEQFELAQEALGIVTWIWDIAADRVQWYGDASRLLGLEPGSYSGRFEAYLAQVHPEDAPRARKTFIDCLKGLHSRYRAIERVCWPDGSVHWLETYGRAEYGPDGRAVHMSGVVKDVSEQQQREAVRVWAEQMLAQVFEASPDYIAISSAKDGRLLAINTAFERITGLRVADAIGRDVRDLNYWVAPQARERMLADLKAGLPVRNRPTQMRVAGNRIVSGLMSAFLIKHNGEELVVGMLRDVTDAEQLERRAHQSERKFGALFVSSPEPVAIARLGDGVHLDVNPAWERATGYTKGQAVGRSSLALGLWADPEARHAVMAILGADGVVHNHPARFRRASGEVFPVLVSGAKLVLDGEACVVWTWRDIGELSAALESARHAERMFGALFESSPEPITLYRVSDGVRLAANEAWERASGYRREQAMGRHVDETLLWKNPGQALAAVRTLEEKGIVTNIESQLTRADGSIFDALVSGVRIYLDGEACVLWTWRDMTELKRLQRQARQLERKFTSLFETSPVALVVSRASQGPATEDRVVEINDAALALIGASRDEALGTNVRQLITWSSVQVIEALRERALRGERVQGAPVQFARRDGRRIDVLLSGVLLEIDREAHFVVAMLDVTERLRVEREKGVADARYRALFEAATDGIVILSPQWEFVDLNLAACEFMGYTREELIGQPMTSVFAMEELEANPLRDHQWTLLERTLRRKDGTPRDIEVQSAPMPDGNYLMIARDISERRRHEQMLMNIARGVSAELGEAFFQSLVGHLARELGADFAFIAELAQPAKDRFRTLAFVADGESAPNFDYPVAGSPCAMALDRRGTVIFPAGAAQQFPEDPGLARLEVEAYVGTSLLAADGSVLGVLVVMHRRPIERGPFWGSMIEIFGARAAAEIERARAEALVRRTNETLEQVVRERTAALEDANRDLESYNYSISHDLRQPLNAIAGFAELLRDAGADVAARERQEFLGEIESNAERMDRMIVSLLQLARAGRGPLTVIDVDMRALVDEVLRELAAGAPLKAKIEVGALPPARGDAHLLRQVWMNLIGNALKYSRKRRAPRVHIRGESRGDRIEYAVSDNGVGFDLRHVDRLFEAFHRLPTASSFEGSGVGLAIVHRILRRHGGQLIPESAPGKGATFRFTLPS